MQTEVRMVKTDHVLFIAAGAFHVSKPSDLIPELQGRFPIRVELKPLTEQDFVRIMTEPENALTKQYQALVAAEGASSSSPPTGSRRWRGSPRWRTTGWRTSARAGCVMAAMAQLGLYFSEFPTFRWTRWWIRPGRPGGPLIVNDDDLRRYIL